VIDLHTHTNYSDGTSSPQELLELAVAAGLRAIAITDHDNLQGYDHARCLTTPVNLELLCGIELTCKLEEKTAHLLAYFLKGAPDPYFREWLTERYEQRRDRNRRLAARLQSLGFDVELEEAEKLGRFMTGRPHFARVMMAKGYVKNIDEAFARYLGEGGVAYVRHDAPDLEEAIERVNQSGGFTSLAHPVRLKVNNEDAVFHSLAGHGLGALEVFHSDHGPAEMARYLEATRRYDLAVTGGSDFHGAIKPRVPLGSVRVEDSILDNLRARFG
jgi:predicted metal-dependent phosphoesterase TrpH